MTNKLLWAESTALNLERVLKKPSHALLIVGPHSSGKHTLARHISAQILNTDEESLHNYPFFTDIEPVETAISIDQVRQLKDFLVLKTTGTNSIRRICIVDRADLMTGEAQNALLKILEEPPKDTMIILIANNQDRLKQTIISRCQVLIVNKPSLELAKDHFKERGYAEADITSKYLLSNGSIGLMSVLLQPDQEHNLLTYVEDAKKLLTQSSYEKFLRVDELSKNRENLVEWLYALRRVCQAALSQAIKTKQAKLIRHWLKCLRSILQCEKDITTGVNLKVMLTKLFDELEYN